MRGRALLLIAVLGVLGLERAEAVSWRMFAGREECLGEYIPESQWEVVSQQQQEALIDIGFVVTSRFGTETSRASVDFTLLDPEGQVIHREEGASETEVAVTARGGRGPWRACFKISRGPVLRPSVMVKVSYFTVNHMSLVGTKFEWQRGGGGQAGGAAAQLDPQLLGTSEQVAELSRGLQRLDYYLQNVTNEQRFLYSRAVRHLRTVESTHARAFWYYFLIYSVIMMASTAQVLGVRMMFKASRKQGLII